MHTILVDSETGVILQSLKSSSLVEERIEFPSDEATSVIAIDDHPHRDDIQMDPSQWYVEGGEIHAKTICVWQVSGSEWYVGEEILIELIPVPDCTVTLWPIWGPSLSIPVSPADSVIEFTPTSSGPVRMAITQESKYWAEPLVLHIQ